MRFGAAGAAWAARQRRRSGRKPGGAEAPPKRPQAAETARRAVGLRPMPAVCRGAAGGLAGSCKGPAGPPARRAGAARAAGRPRRSRGARRAVWAAGCGAFFAGSCKGRCGRSPGGAAAPPKRPQAAETARRAVGLRPMPAVCRGGAAPMQNREDGRCGGAPIHVIYPRKYNPERSRYGKPEN